MQIPSRLQYHLDRLKLELLQPEQPNEEFVDHLTQIFETLIELETLFTSGHSTPEFWERVRTMKPDIPETRLILKHEKCFRLAVRRFNGAISKSKKKQTRSGVAREVDTVPDST